MLRLTVAELLRVLARRKKMSIVALAKELGYRPMTLYSKMHKDKWKIDDLQKIKDYFGITLDDILDKM